MKIPLEEVQAWLKVINPTHLSIVSRKMIDSLKSESLSDRNVENLIQDVLNFTRKSVDPLEYAEALTHCAVVRETNNDLKSALDYMKTAADLYQGNNYKYAVVLWMLGWIEWRLLENRKAYVNWIDARDLLKSIVASLSKTRKAVYFEQIPWFLERIDEMNQELVLQPEEAYMWINLFEPSNLNETALLFRDLLDQRIAQDKGASAYKIMQAMQELFEDAPDYLTTPEVLVEAGLAAHQLGIDYESELLLKKAVGLYKPESHQQASVLWMLGAVRLNMEDNVVEAVRNWERSIEIFERIPDRLKPRERESYREWKHVVMPLLRKAMEGALSGYA